MLMQALMAKHPGTHDLVAVGNVGLINKDYGRDQTIQ